MKLFYLKNFKFDFKAKNLLYNKILKPARFGTKIDRILNLKHTSLNNMEKEKELEPVKMLTKVKYIC